LVSYNTVKNLFILDEKSVRWMKEKSILMHPLPRVNELPVEVDLLPQATYFEQAKNWVPVRMALIKYCLEK
jgi:aspartate carbamoyltransferase catalytic subunit